MALVPCAECGKDVSTLATACPHCGAPIAPSAPSQPVSSPPRKKKFKWLTALAWFFGILFFIGLFLGGPPKKEDSKTDAQVIAPEPAKEAATKWRPDIGTWVKLPDSEWGCAGWDDYKKLRELAYSQDRQAFARLLVAACTQLKKGVEVHIDDGAPFSGAYQVRPRGSLIAYWVPENIFKPKGLTE